MQIHNLLLINWHEKECLDDDEAYIFPSRNYLCTENDCSERYFYYVGTQPPALDIVVGVAISVTSQAVSEYSV